MLKKLPVISFLLAFGLLGWCLLSAPVAAGEADHSSELLFMKGKMYVKDVSVEVYQEPSAKAAIIFRIFSGETLEVVEVKGSWSHIKTLEGLEGWILTSSLSNIFVASKEVGRYLPPQVIQNSLDQIFQNLDDSGKGFLMIMADLEPKMVERSYITLHPVPKPLFSFFDESVKGREFRFFLRKSILQFSGLKKTTIMAVAQGFLGNETLASEFLRTLFLSPETMASGYIGPEFLQKYFVHGKDYFQEKEYLKCFYQMKVLYLLSPSNLEAYKYKGRAEDALKKESQSRKTQ